MGIFIVVCASGGKTRASSRAHFWKHAYVTGSGGLGCVNVHVNLRHMHMLRHVLGWVCVCVCVCVNVHIDLRHMHMLCHVLGWGGVNVHVNLRHMRMLRQVLGWVCVCVCVCVC